MGLAGAALISAALGLWAWSPAPRAPGSPGQPAEAPLPPDAPPKAQATAPAGWLDDLPESLRGADPDGGFTLDANGRLVPGRDAFARFEWFLSATGEEPPEALRARIVRHLRESLPPGAAADAEAFLDQVLAYRDAMRGLTEGGAVPADLERRLQWIRETRRAHFGAALAETLFGEEEQVAMLDLERRAVVLDPTLTPEQRDAKLAAIEARLPDAVREARESATAPARVAKQVEAVRARGGSDAEVFAVRERAFGADAAERLAALDVERAEWKARLEAWRGELAAIESDASLSPEEKAAAIEATRSQRFSDEEQVRVEALEREP